MDSNSSYMVISAATCPSGSSSSLSVTLSLHLRSMEPSGQESSEDGTRISEVSVYILEKTT